MWRSRVQPTRPEPFIRLPKLPRAYRPPKRLSRRRGVGVTHPVVVPVLEPVVAVFGAL